MLRLVVLPVLGLERLDWAGRYNLTGSLAGWLEAETGGGPAGQPWQAALLHTEIQPRLVLDTQTGCDQSGVAQVERINRTCTVSVFPLFSSLSAKDKFFLQSVLQISDLQLSLEYETVELNFTGLDEGFEPVVQALILSLTHRATSLVVGAVRHLVANMASSLLCSDNEATGTYPTETTEIFYDFIDFK